MSVEQRDYLVERDYSHPPAAVFAAWSDPDLKRAWFDLAGGEGSHWHSECRVGGTELYRSPPGAAPSVDYEAVHRDVVPGERLVLTSRITVDGRTSSLALTTAEFVPVAPRGTLLRVTEHVTFLDGLEDPGTRKTGLEAQLSGLGDLLSTDRQT